MSRKTPEQMFPRSLALLASAHKSIEAGLAALDEDIREAEARELLAASDKAIIQHARRYRVDIGATLHRVRANIDALLIKHKAAGDE